MIQMRQMHADCFVNRPEQDIQRHSIKNFVNVASHLKREIFEILIQQKRVIKSYHKLHTMVFILECNPIAPPKLKLLPSPLHS